MDLLVEAKSGRWFLRCYLQPRQPPTAPFRFCHRTVRQHQGTSSSCPTNALEIIMENDGIQTRDHRPAFPLKSRFYTANVKKVLRRRSEPSPTDDTSRRRLRLVTTVRPNRSETPSSTWAFVGPSRISTFAPLAAVIFAAENFRHFAGQSFGRPWLGDPPWESPDPRVPGDRVAGRWPRSGRRAAVALLMGRPEVFRAVGVVVVQIPLRVWRDPFATPGAVGIAGFDHPGPPLSGQGVGSRIPGTPRLAWARSFRPRGVGPIFIGERKISMRVENLTCP